MNKMKKISRTDFKTQNKPKGLKFLNFLIGCFEVIIIGSIAKLYWPFWTNINKFLVFIIFLVGFIVISPTLLKLTKYFYYKFSK